MRKNIKKIISTILVTISIFALAGCGQSKEELKEEIKQEIKAEEEQAKVDAEEQKKVEGEKLAEEGKNITIEDLNSFKGLFSRYSSDMGKALSFNLPEGNAGHITLEKGKEIKTQVTDITKADLIKATPSVLKEPVEKYLNSYEEYFTLVSKGEGNYDESERMSISKDIKTNSDAIIEKLTQLDKVVTRK